MLKSSNLENSAKSAKIVLLARDDVIGVKISYGAQSRNVFNHNPQSIARDPDDERARERRRRSSRDFVIPRRRSGARILRIVVTVRRGLVLATSFPFVHLAIKP